MTLLKPFLKNLLFLVMYTQLASCSLAPLYGNEHNAGGKIRNIEIEEIDGVHGSEIYYQLTKLIGSSRDTKYSLKIQLASDNTYPLAISAESELLKQNISEQYSYILTDKQDGKTLDYGQVRVVGSYNAMDSSFNSYTNEKFTKKNIAQNIAEEIHMRLRLYFASH